MRQTIGRNQRKKVGEIFANAQDIKIYTLDNGFTGRSGNREDYQGENWLLKEWNNFSFAKLTQEGENKYCLHIHNNCWYEFTN